MKQLQEGSFWSAILISTLVAPTIYATYGLFETFKVVTVLSGFIFSLVITIAHYLVAVPSITILWKRGLINDKTVHLVSFIAAGLPLSIASYGTSIFSPLYTFFVFGILGVCSSITFMCFWNKQLPQFVRHIAYEDQPPPNE